MPDAIPHELVPALTSVLEMIAELTARIDAMDKTIVALIRDRYPAAQFLQQYPASGH